MARGGGGSVREVLVVAVPAGFSGDGTDVELVAGSEGDVVTVETLSTVRTRPRSGPSTTSATTTTAAAAAAPSWRRAGSGGAAGACGG